MKKVHTIILLAFLGLSINNSHAQCSYPSPPMYIQNVTLTTNWQTLQANSGDVYVFNANQNDTVIFSFCHGGGSSSVDTSIFNTIIIRILRVIMS